MTKLIRQIGIAVWVVVALGLAACSKEPQERADFIQLLQTRMLDKPGLSMPRLNDQEKKKLGDYLPQFEVMSDFHRSMNESVLGKTPPLLKERGVKTIADIMKRRDEVAALRDVLGGYRAALDAVQAKADAAHAALKQPDDLKLVYDKVYAKSVTVPSNTYRDTFPLMDKGISTALELADYLKQNESKLTVNGMLIETQDPIILKEVDAKLAAMNQHNKNLTEALRNFNGMVYGK